MSCVGGEPGEYVCTLDEKSLKRAKEELNEDEKNRLGAVETLRKWILQQPHIKCPTDAAFLLLFLRARYFLQLEARELLERYVAKGTKLAKWMKNLESSEPKILKVIDDGSFLILPERDDDGRKILLLRPGKIDLSGNMGYTMTDVYRTYVCLITYTYLLDEVTCVNGTVALADMSGYSMKIHAAMSAEERREFIQAWQRAYPGRLKEVHLYNAGLMSDIVLSIVQLYMPEKLQKRVKYHGQTLHTMQRDVPKRCLPVEYLPEDYKGPNAGTIKQITENMKKELTKPEVRNRIKYLTSDQFGINEALKPKESQPQASFRKLNVE